MAFVAKLPSWTTEVEFYRKTGDTWDAHTTIVGQVYTPLRSQDDMSGGMLYFMCPKETGDVLRDSFDGVADVAVVNFAAASWTRAYRVREVKPRWLNFSNQHLLVELQRLKASQFSLPDDEEDEEQEVIPCEYCTSETPLSWTTTFSTFSNECAGEATIDCSKLNGEYTLTQVESFSVEPSIFDSANFVGEEGCRWEYADEERCFQLFRVNENEISAEGEWWLYSLALVCGMEDEWHGIIWSFDGTVTGVDNLTLTPATTITGVCAVAGSGTMTEAVLTPV